MTAETRVGLISDIHSNHVALERVLEDMPPVDHIACVGDVVGYGPSPERCLTTLQRRSIPTVQGNHDEMVANGRRYEPGDQYAVDQLTDEQRDWLGQLPRERHLLDGQLKLVHSHPTDDNTYVYPEDFAAALLADESVLALGHTHVQHAETFGSEVVINPGSVGQPRDGDPRAAYAVISLPDLSVECRRVEYDIDTVQARIADTPISRRNAKRLAGGQ